MTERLPRRILLVPELWRQRNTFSYDLITLWDAIWEEALSPGNAPESGTDLDLDQDAESDADVDLDVDGGCRTTYPEVDECWELPEEYEYDSAHAALVQMKRAAGVKDLKLHNREPALVGPCPAVGDHWNVRDKGERAGSITCCPCCVDLGDRPLVEQRCRVVW